MPALGDDDATFLAVQTSPEAAAARTQAVDDVMRAVAAYARAHATPDTEVMLASLWRCRTPVAFELESPDRQAEAAIVVTLPELRVVKDRYRFVPVDAVLEVPALEPPVT